MGSPSISFETALRAFGNNTGIEVPAEVIERLGGGNRPAVVVDVNGYVYQSTIAVMGGKHLISVSAAIRRETGLSGGDSIVVKLTLAAGPRPVVVPADLAAALDDEPIARRFFDGLSNSLQRYHCDNIVGAKSAETRQRRISKAIELFVAGKPR
jgi:actin-like ATPase involved in cell morphogenesis